MVVWVYSVDSFQRCGHLRLTLDMHLNDVGFVRFFLVKPAEAEPKTCWGIAASSSVCHLSPERKRPYNFQRIHDGNTAMALICIDISCECQWSIPNYVSSNRRYFDEPTWLLEMTRYRCHDHGWKSCSQWCPPCCAMQDATVQFGRFHSAGCNSAMSWSLLWFTPRGPIMTPMNGAWTHLGSSFC